MPKVKEVRRMLNGHLGIEFEDGTQAVVPRGEHEELNLKPGDEYPPAAPSVLEPVAEEEEIEFEELADEEHEEDLLDPKPKKRVKKSSKKK